MRDGLADQRKPDCIKFGAHRDLHVIARSSVARKQYFYFSTQRRIIAASLI